MSEHIDPTLGRYEPLGPAQPDLPTDQPADADPMPAQTLQRRRCALDALVRNLSEPALAHRDGRIVAVNDALVRLLDHPAPEMLIGLNADALLEHVLDGTEDRAHLAALTSARGPIPVGLRTRSLEVPGEDGVLWVFGDPPVRPDVAKQGAARVVEALCERLWLDDMPSREELLAALVTVGELLEPSDERTHVPRSDLAESVQSLLPDRQLDIRARPMLDLPPDSLLHLLEPALQRLPEGSRVRVDIDVAGHPVVILRHRTSPVVPDASDLARVRILVGNLRGSAVSLDAGRVLRLRLPPMRAAGEVR